MLRIAALVGSLATAALLVAPGHSPVQAATFSSVGQTAVYDGAFYQDDDVHIFRFNVAAPNLIMEFETFSYAGGTTRTGRDVPSGGFDPILTLFDGFGEHIASNDDGWRRFDPETGAGWDPYLRLPLGQGTYHIAISQYDNFAFGLLDGFIRDGQGNFTADWCAAGAFCDVAGSARTPNYTLQIAAIPLPAGLPLLLGGIAAIGALRLKRRDAT